MQVFSLTEGFSEDEDFVFPTDEEIDMEYSSSEDSEPWQMDDPDLDLWMFEDDGDDEVEEVAVENNDVAEDDELEPLFDFQ
jgi:hypothetical protein